jgi:hypothetical protein
MSEQNLKSSVRSTNNGMTTITQSATISNKGEKIREHHTSSDF